MNVYLYEMAVNVEQPPQTLLVSPATLLSLAKSMIDLLIEQQISAKLWIKLPPGEIWRSEIRRYQEQVGMLRNIYIYYLDIEKPESSKHGVYSSIVEVGKYSSKASIPLATESQLKREYFLLALSPQFCGLILAHRPCIKRKPESFKKADAKHKPPLLAISSFDGLVIQRVLDGIKQAIVFSLSKTSSGTQVLAASASVAKNEATHLLHEQKEAKKIHAEMLDNWDSRFICPPAADPVLINQLLVKQIQEQDKIRHQTKTRSEASSTPKNRALPNQKLFNSLYLKEDFIDKLCQELRTPLAHMKMALSLLSSPQLKPNQRLRYLQVLNTECDRQNSLINGLLELVQLDRVAEQSALMPVRLSDIVPGVVSTYQPLAEEKGIRLAYKVPDILPAVSCLSPWIKQIVINLLHNSIKFTPDGGQVSVRARRQGNYVQMEFRDTGIGIPLNEIPKIFDLFYRVRPVVSEDPGGAGFGLTIVQQLLLRCGGSISVISKLGEGSVFNVQLPVAQLREQR